MKASCFVSAKITVDLGTVHGQSFCGEANALDVTMASLGNWVRSRPWHEEMPGSRLC